MIFRPLGSQRVGVTPEEGGLVRLNLADPELICRWQDMVKVMDALAKAIQQSKKWEYQKQDDKLDPERDLAHVRERHG